MAGMHDVRSDLILHAIARRHAMAKDLFFTEVKDGPTLWGEHRRIDAIAIKPSWRHPCITGYEVKVNRKDFERDMKWPGYRDMCHKLFFACPAGLIQPEELPEDVGLIWYNPEKRTIFTKRAAVFRDIEIPWQMLYYLVICRTDSDRHPFFSNRREYLEAWVEDREERKKLGFYVSNKMTQEIEVLNKQIRELKREVERGKEAISEIEKVRAILEELGLRTGYGWMDDLERALKERVSPALIKGLDVISREVEQMRVLLRSVNAGG